MPIPALPGRLVDTQSEEGSFLRRHVATLCHLDNDRFPGSQPISFSVNHMQRLEREDFWVCEKSDGVRVLFLVCTGVHAPDDQRVYIIDRHNTYRELEGFFFPHHENPQRPLGNSLLDGELVIDVDPRTRTETTRFLAFDCLVVDGMNVMGRTLDKRYGRLQNFFHRPYRKMLKEFTQMAASQPFDILIKQMERAYAVDKIFNTVIPALQHGNDGLIYTCVTKPYSPGTDENILKWKPPSENSIDFKLVLRFPPLQGRPHDPDFSARPVFSLHTWLGGEGARARYEPFDVLDVSDAEWEAMKAGGEQLDERIAEVLWDMARECWRLLRFRDDKPNGNHRSVVDKIMQSIEDGVEKDALIARVSAIRHAWKAREAVGGPPPSAAGGGGTAGQPPRPSGGPPPTASTGALPVPELKLRYGPLTTPRWSKVAGPIEVGGMLR